MYEWMLGLNPISGLWLIILDDMLVEDLQY